ncbi:MAG: HU family DNA-binding protein [Actinomycetota bacterium]
MNKAELVEAVAEATSDSKARAGEFVDATLDTIQAALAGRDKVTIPGFGTFSARPRAARTGRNPQTGAPVKIKATTVPAFKPGSELKSVVAAGKVAKKAAPKAKAKAKAKPKAPAKKAAAKKKK